MMIFCYNFLQLLLLPIVLPIITIIVFSRKKYRQRTPLRLGFALSKRLPKKDSRPVFWIHALSAGEAASAIPLVKALRAARPNASIVFSTTTNSGQQVAEKLYPEYIDSLIYSPIDILPVVRYFINTTRPDCFLLVETDFWPNLLYSLNRKKIPVILVNGRVSDEALQGYRKMAFFCRPMFGWFDALCLQKEEDREKFAKFGIEKSKLHTLGNLKFAAQPPIKTTSSQEIGSMLPPEKLCLLAGSTHPGEEEILIAALLLLKKDFPSLFLIIAPRDPARAPAIKKYCREKGLSASLRSERRTPPSTKEVLLLDTIGELAACYQLADIAFIGGSMVNQRGHNPLEPALFGRPVLFGSSMEDFSEIATGLLSAGGAFQVKNSTELTTILRQLLKSPTMRKEAGTAARKYINKQQGGIECHLQLITSFMEKRGKKM